MKEQVVRLAAEAVRGYFPKLPNIKKYIKLVIFAVIGLFILGVTIVSLLIYLIIRLIAGSGSNIVDQGTQMVESGRQSIEERLNTDEKALEELRIQVENLQKQLPGSNDSN